MTADDRALLAERVRRALARFEHVREVRMFGGLSFMVDERMAVAARVGGDLLVRVDPARYDELLARGGEPALMGEGRPMGSGWLAVPRQRIEDDAELASWIDIGLDARGEHRR